MKLSISFGIGRFRVEVSYLILVFLLAAMITKTAGSYLLTFLFIIIHEAAHIITALLSGAGVYNIRFLPVGLNAVIDDGVCSRRQRVAIYSAGPFMSFLLAVIFSIIIIVLESNSPVLKMGAYINFYLCGFNLLPILPLDGGKLAMELLSARLGVFKAGKGLHFLTVILSISIILTGIISFCNTGKNISLLIIGLYILFCIKVNREETAFMNIKNFIFRKTRVMRKGIYPVREIVVLKSVKLSEVIKAMDYVDRFHIINVLDDDFKVIKVMTEQEVLDAIIGSTPDTTFEKLMQIEYNVHNEAN